MAETKQLLLRLTVDSSSLEPERLSELKQEFLRLCVDNIITKSATWVSEVLQTTSSDAPVCELVGILFQCADQIEVCITISFCFQSDFLKVLHGQSYVTQNLCLPSRPEREISLRVSSDAFFQVCLELLLLPFISIMKTGEHSCC